MLVLCEDPQSGGMWLNIYIYIYVQQPYLTSAKARTVAKPVEASDSITVS